MYTLTFTRQSIRDLRRLPPDLSRRILLKLRQYAADPASQGNNVKRLTGQKGYRLRVGDWRVIFLVEDEQSEVTIVRVASRGGVYQ